MSAKSRSEIKLEIERLNKQYEESAEATKRKLREEFDARLAAEDLKLADVYPEFASKLGKRGGPASSSKAGEKKTGGVAKYRNPHNLKEFWSGGRGPRPAWVVEACETHQLTIDQFMTDERFLNPDAK